MRYLLCACVVMACGPKPASPQLVSVLPDDKPVDAAPAKTPEPKRDDWAGTLVLPHSLVDIVVHFTERDGTWSATIDVPGTKLVGRELAAVMYTAESIRFTIPKPENPQLQETYVFTRSADEATGKVLLGGQAFHAKMMKLAPGQPALSIISRPQTPKPPFPYTTKDVNIEVKAAATAADAASLAGTLTLPEGKGPFPAIVMISGSGQQDRDETIFGHKPFAVIADRLARDGIATLRTDDRGIGKTTGPLGSIDTDIADATAAFQWLIKQPEIDPKRVGLLGHSIGGVIAPFVAVKTGKVAFIIGLAAPGVSGVELVPMQLELELGIRKLPDKLIKAIVDGQRAVGKAIVGGKEAEIKAALRASFVAAAMAMGAPKPSDADLDQAIASKMPEVSNPWTISFFKTDPAKAWAKLTIPVLLVIGDKDTQVPPDQNIARITAALRKANNKALTTEKRPGLNHLYQKAQSGTAEEYGELEETFELATLDLIAKWAVARTAPKR
ncbi:MAG: alpha/beta hydrolase [Deltaproteobacteria bacterium]|nr:alpha/beta hydrolase [Deltaproteobacteria bacterium]